MASTKCPRCNVMVEVRPVIVDGKVVDLGNSNSMTTHTINGRYELSVDQGYANQPGYTIVLCGNCDGRFVAENQFGSFQPVWPLSGVDIDESIPIEIAEAVINAKLSHAVAAELAALLAARTALIRLQRDQKVSSIKELVDAGKLTLVLYQQADEVRLWANAQGHDDIQAGTIDSADVEELLEYLDVVLRAIFIDPARLKKRQEERNSLGR